MLFNVEHDRGTMITAYVVPDSGATTPTIRLRSKGAEVLTLDANETRANLVAAGRHATGRCGFVLDETLVPDLAALDDLEITEATTNLLVYRRRPPAAKDIKILRFETHLLPLWRVDEAIKDKFQFWYKGIDRYGRETSTQVFCLNNSGSSYVSGRLLFKNFEYYLGNGIKTVGIIRDPYLELAERLILLKNIGGRADEILGARDALTFAPVIEALDEFEVFDETFCKRFFRRAPEEVLSVLSNPLVRQLTGATPDEMPTHSSVATALDALAMFEVLGLRSDSARFSQALADLMETDAAAIPVIDEYPRIIQFGERLRSIHDIEGFLEKDLEVFHLITGAFQAAEA